LLAQLTVQAHRRPIEFKTTADGEKRDGAAAAAVGADKGDKCTEVEVSISEVLGWSHDSATHWVPAGPRADGGWGVPAGPPRTHHSLVRPKTCRGPGRPEIVDFLDLWPEISPGPPFGTHPHGLRD